MFGVLIDIKGNFETVEYPEHSSHKSGIAGEILGDMPTFVGACEEYGLLILADSKATEINTFKFPKKFTTEETFSGNLLLIKGNYTNNAFDVENFTKHDFEELLDIE